MMRIMKVQNERTKKENLIMSGKFKRILYGGDYNPNQWPKEIWKEDMAYFKEARINTALPSMFFPGPSSSLLKRSMIFQNWMRSWIC